MYAIIKKRYIKYICKTDLYYIRIYDSYFCSIYLFIIFFLFFLQDLSFKPIYEYRDPYFLIDIFCIRVQMFCIGYDQRLFQSSDFQKQLYNMSGNFEVLCHKSGQVSKIFIPCSTAKAYRWCT